VLLLWAGQRGVAGRGNVNQRATGALTVPVPAGYVLFSESLTVARPLCTGLQTSRVPHFGGIRQEGVSSLL